MPDSGLSFQSLPDEYQQVIQLAGDQLNITITPLQELVGGWSGAVIYLVSVASADSGQVEHLILKLDRKRPMSTTDEITRHQVARGKSPPDFARRHIPEIVYERVEGEGARVGTDDDLAVGRRGDRRVLTPSDERRGKKQDECGNGSHRSHRNLPHQSE